MKKKIIMKSNGVISYSTREVLGNESPLLKESDKCFTGVLTDVSKENKLLLKDIKLFVYHIISELSKSYKSDIIDSMYDRLKECNTKEDIINVFNYLYDSYKIYFGENDKKTSVEAYRIFAKKTSVYDNYVENNMDIVISIMIKRLIVIHYLKMLTNIKVDDLKQLENLKLSGANCEELFKYVNEEFSDTSVKNGIEELSKKIFFDTIDFVFDERQEHLCWHSCVNSYPLQCRKVFDGVKRNIDEYDFITDGYQIFDKNGEVEHFVVTGCTNYSNRRIKK